MFAAPAAADTPPPADFSQCVAELQSRARLEGVSEKTNQGVLANVRHLDKVIGYDRSQPEFVQTFPDYLNKRVNQWRIDKGRAMAAKHKDLLKALTRTYGIPGHYLLAFWGLETNFGAYKGKMPIIDSLATLACDPRRSAFFADELMLALKLIDREDLSVERMVGSWAGAMGHTQFMPSAYTAYARDGDGDGKIDLWNSEVDALTSAAHFLQQLGWKAGYKWGREVRLPEAFDYGLAGKDNPRSLSEWAGIGVTEADGKPLPDVDISGALLVPAGHQGPAFIVYDNFDVILRWNNSEFYALAVGYLADRIVGKPAWVAPLPDLPVLDIAAVKDLQHGLNQLGIDVGKADGILGPATRKGVRQFQARHNMIADGFPYPEVMEAVKTASQSPQPVPSSGTGN
ncbi:lytic murein transglycosylase [Aestuariibacter halophilus]|uniref:Lytic murein transglycosylase n=1 Tax=Fluctibacter halophilus TaxID=226011 RepID=A0ABS8GCU6_9ALTE|nr:lytic murein transglycosylase [Aestuariibacter halophilus]MCC2618323.1 lytic murein transglycosylase [Aestuariibacter halophilus]